MVIRFSVCVRACANPQPKVFTVCSISNLFINPVTLFESPDNELRTTIIILTSWLVWTRYWWPKIAGRLSVSQGYEAHAKTPDTAENTHALYLSLKRLIKSPFGVPLLPLKQVMHTAMWFDAITHVCNKSITQHSSDGVRLSHPRLQPWIFINV